VTIIDTVHQALWERRPNEESVDLDGQIRSILRDVDPLASASTIAAVIAEVRARVDGLGPLQNLGDDPSVSEIMVNGDGSVWVERHGQLSCTSVTIDEAAAMDLIRRLAAHSGRSIDMRSPAVDVRLADGSRFHAIIPPLAVDGPCITIRRFVARSVDVGDMAFGRHHDELVRAVESGETILVAGATSSGKTTLLNALGAHLCDDLRVVTIEDAAELQLPGRHVVRLETRSATENTSATTIRDLVRHALRMRPDRIICGEMRGVEALDLVQAMNTGHRGSMSTVHASSPLGVMRRVETMMLLADADLPLRAIREQLASSIDLVVMMERRPGGEREVSQLWRGQLDRDAHWEERR